MIIVLKNRHVFRIRAHLISILYILLFITTRTKPRIVHKSSNATCPTQLLKYYLLIVRYTERTELRKVRFRRADRQITTSPC